jgi:hypothetical protein
VDHVRLIAMSYGDADAEPVEEDVHCDAGTEPGSGSGANSALKPVKPGENVICAAGTPKPIRGLAQKTWLLMLVLNLRWVTCLSMRVLGLGREILSMTRVRSLEPGT